MTDDKALERVYEHRFPDSEAVKKEAVWSQISRYLQRWVPRNGTVLDIGCDTGLFVRHIRARERWGSDIRDVSPALAPDIHFVRASGLDLLRHLPSGHFDAIFMSNYLEHLRDGHAVIEQFNVAAALLRPGGRAIVLQPNIRLVGGRYWDFIDHRVALTERSLVEAASLSGLETEVLYTRFLPYTTKSRLPQAAWLVRAYLSFPPAWRVLGKQTLYVGRRPRQ